MELELESARVVCCQCGVRSFPHSICRCQHCLRRHHIGGRCIARSATSEGSNIASIISTRRSRCTQCGELSLPHAECLCTTCRTVHRRNRRCRPPRPVAAVAARPQPLFKAALTNASCPVICHVGAMDIPCPFCGALKWPQEKINCCAYGDIQLNVSHDVPPEIAAIIYSPHVLKNIRVYNMALSMASVGHQNKSLPDGMFVLGGRTYHRVGSMLPQGNAPPAFAQIYVLDVEEATDRRLEISD